MKRQERKQFSKRQNRQQQRKIIKKGLGESNVTWVTCFHEW